MAKLGGRCFLEDVSREMAPAKFRKPVNPLEIAYRKAQLPTTLSRGSALGQELSQNNSSQQREMLCRRRRDSCALCPRPSSSGEEAEAECGPV